jgi:hypothetical protein
MAGTRKVNLRETTILFPLKNFNSLNINTILLFIVRHFARQKLIVELASL